MMSALGKREQILGRAQEREEKAGAPVPTAAGPPQTGISHHHLPTPKVLLGGLELGRGTNSPQHIQCHHCPQETPP